MPLRLTPGASLMPESISLCAELFQLEMRLQLSLFHVHALYKATIIFYWAFIKRPLKPSKIPA